MKILVTENQLKKLINLITEDGDKMNVMFVGDSHSAGKGWTWNYLLEKEHPEWNVTHVTKGGKRTDWMLSNMKNELTKKKYDLVFIYGGTNDVMSPIKNDVPISNVQKMVDEVNNQGGKAVVVSGFDQESIFDPKKVKPTIYCDKKCFENFKPKRVDYQQRLPQAISNATFVPKLVGDTSWTNDGIHAVPAKHKLLKDLVSSYITNIKSSTKNTSKSNTDNTGEQKEQFKKFFENYFKFLEKNKDVNENSIKNDIKRMQIVLSMVLKKSLDNKKLGTLDSETKSDIIDFQSKNGLKETGYFDVQTQQTLTKKLFPSYTPKTKSNPEETQSVENVTTITEPGVQVRSIPSDLEQQFKNIPGVDYGKFKSEIESAGIPVKFAIRQLFVESAFSPDVISCKRKSTSGAMGLAQFMPTTWPAYGKGGDPCKPQDALPAYVRLMTQLVKRFPGRLDLAFAGYNSGPNFKFPTGPDKGKMVYDYAFKNKTPFKDLKGIIPNEAYAYSSSILQP
jgi:peptidoglycan hydrolase-like protein with peptidoglycan-binding domain